MSPEDRIVGFTKEEGKRKSNGGKMMGSRDGKGENECGSLREP